MNRRNFLLTGAAGLTVGIAGCTDDAYPSVDESTQVTDLPHPTRGDDDAPVRVRVFEDFKCPHCASFSLNIFPQLETDYIESGDIQYEARDYPIPVESPGSYYLANAVRYVQDVADNPDDYWAFREYVFENQTSAEYDAFDTRAAEYGGTADDAAHARKGVYHPVIMNDRQQGAELGVSATPGVFVNGTHLNSKYSDGFNYEQIAETIEENL